MAEQQGITKISVQGFKSLYDKAEVEIRALTVLAGANSSGKSSIMQPLLLMKQTLEASYETGTFRLDGPILSFTSDEQFLSNIVDYLENDRPVYEMVIGIEINMGTFEQTYAKLDPFLVPIAMNYRGNDRNLNLRMNMNHEDIIEMIGDEGDNIRQITENAADTNLFWRTKPSRCLLVLALDSNNEDFLSVFTYARSKVFPIFDLERAIIDIIHVKGLRSEPKRSYPITANLQRTFEGTFEPYTASIINLWQLSGKTEDIQQLEKLSTQLKFIGLTSNITAQALNDAQIEVRVGRSMNAKPEDMVSIADVGFGVSQVLPVLVALLVAKAGQLVYVEQPELHLHPRAQVKLAQILADAAKRGVRVVVETHSSLLLLGIQTLIAEGKLENEKVILHWFKRDEEGKTSINSVVPDENGAYGDWDEDFGEVELETQARYIEAVEKRAWGEPSGD